VFEEEIGRCLPFSTREITSGNKNAYPVQPTNFSLNLEHPLWSGCFPFVVIIFLRSFFKGKIKYIFLSLLTSMERHLKEKLPQNNGSFTT